MEEATQGKKRQRKRSHSLQQQLFLDNDVVDSWRAIGESEGFKTDSRIAKFLISLYLQGHFTPKAEDDNVICAQCGSPLMLYCVNCQLPRQIPATHASSTLLKKRQMSPAVVDKILSFKNHQQTSASLNKAKSLQMTFLDEQIDLKSSVVVNSQITDKEASKHGSSDSNDINDSDNEVRTCVESVSKFEIADKVALKCLTDAVYLDDNGGNVAKNSASDNSSPASCQAVQKPLIVKNLLKPASTSHINIYTANQASGLPHQVSAMQHTSDLSQSAQPIEKRRPYSSEKKATQDRRDLKPAHRATNSTAVSLLNKCEVCEKHFKTKKSLKVHMKGKHVTDPKWKHQCHLCEKSYRSRNDFEAHLDKHLGTKTNLCYLCGSSFSHAKSLARHVKLCQKKDKTVVTMAEKMYPCKMCDRVFSSYTMRVDHTRAMHTDLVYLCNKCGKSLKWRCSYRRHLRICTGLMEGKRRRYPATRKKRMPKVKRSSISMAGAEKGAVVADATTAAVVWLGSDLSLAVPSTQATVWPWPVQNFM